MAKLNDLFETFLGEIEPDGATKKYAKTAQEKIREHLEEVDDFQKCVLGSYLYGSYKRHTAITDIKDVDIVVLTNFDIKSSENTPDKILRKLKNALTRYYKDSDNTVYQRRSILVKDPLHEENTDITLDIIPAVLVDESDTTIYVPDRELKEWILSNPKKHIERTSKLNESSDEKFVPLVKMIKWWWKYQSKQKQSNVERPKPKGFWIECLVVENFDNDRIEWADHFIATLTNISSKFAGVTGVPELIDPGLPNQSISSSTSFEEFQFFMNTVNESLKIAINAEAEQNEEVSSKLWQKIFGEKFPLGENVSSDKVYFKSTPFLLGDYSHRESIRWPENKIYSVRIDAYLYTKDKKKRLRGINSDAHFLSTLSILYRAKTNTLKPYKVYWQVVNTGSHAAREKELRGQIFPKDNEGAKLDQWESSLYTGRHWIECFIVKDDYCVARRIFFVNIKNPSF